MIGGALWGGLFYAAQWPALAPFLQPVILHGQVLTVADTISFETGRSQGPEYLRMVERGSLRALVDDVTMIVSFFAGMVSVGHVLGRRGDRAPGGHRAGRPVRQAAERLRWCRC